MLKFYFLFTRVFYFYSIISNDAEYYESNKTAELPRKALYKRNISEFPNSIHYLYFLAGL